MGLFGGSSQSTSSSSNILDFAPTFNIGDGITSTLDKQLDQTTSTSPRLDDSFGLSAAVGVALGDGDATGGTASTSRSQQEDNQPLTVDNISGEKMELGKYLPYVLVGGAGLTALYLYKSKK